MDLKLAYAALLSLASLATRVDAQFMPPASATCLASNLVTGGDFLDCCPSADPNDGICTIIWCINRDSGESLIRDNCKCGEVETACDQLASFADMVPGLSDACAAMGDCCEAGVTANSDFASCTQESLAALNLTLPDYNSLVPGGVPDLDALLGSGNATTVAAATIPAEVTTTVAAETGANATTVAVMTIPAEIATTVAAMTIPAEVTTTTIAAATIPAEVTTTTIAAATIPAEVTTTTAAETGTSTTAVAATTTAAAAKEAADTTSGASTYAANVAFSFIVTIPLAMQYIV